MKQLTKEQAIQFYRSEAWKKLDTKTLALFQLEQRLLCCPFDVFHQAVEETLQRPICTHEFRNVAVLLEEANGLKKAPTFEEIMAMLPPEKTIVVAM